MTVLWLESLYGGRVGKIGGYLTLAGRVCRGYSVWRMHSVPGWVIPDRIRLRFSNRSGRATAYVWCFLCVGVHPLLHSRATHCLLISFAALLPTLARARHEFTGRAALPGLLCTLQCVLHVLSPAVHSCMCATYRVAFLLERRGCPFRTRLASESTPLLAVAVAFAFAVLLSASVLGFRS